MKRFFGAALFLIFICPVLPSTFAAEETPEEALHRLESKGVSVDSLRLKAEIAETAGKTEEALNNYDAAIALYYKQNPRGAEPPLDLVSNQKRLFNKMITDKGEDAYAKPDQIPPPEVMAAARAGEDPPEEEVKDDAKDEAKDQQEAEPKDAEPKDADAKEKAEE